MTTTDVTARRLRRPSWTDARLLTGIVLMAGSVALGARLVAMADHRVPVYAASSALVPGERLSLDRLTRVDVALGDAASPYVAADQGLPEDAVVAREVRPGELLPASAVVSAAQSRRAPVVIPVAADSARVLTAGSTVDVWVNEKAPGTGAATYGVPKLQIKAAPVGRVVQDPDARFATGGTVGVQVMIPSGDVERILAMVDQGGKVSLLPTPGSAQRER